MTAIITLTVSTLFWVTIKVATITMMTMKIITNIDNDAYLAFSSYPHMGPCTDVIVSAAARRSVLVGGGAPSVPKKSAAAARRGVRGQHFLSKVPEKFRSILKIF